MGRRWAGRQGVGRARERRAGLPDPGSPGRAQPRARAGGAVPSCPVPSRPVSPGALSCPCAHPVLGPGPAAGLAGTAAPLCPGAGLSPRLSGMKLKKQVTVCGAAIFCVAVFSLYLMLDRVQHDPTRHQSGGNFPRVSGRAVGTGERASGPGLAGASWHSLRLFGCPGQGLFPAGVSARRGRDLPGKGHWRLSPRHVCPQSQISVLQNRIEQLEQLLEENHEIISHIKDSVLELTAHAEGQPALPHHTPNGSWVLPPESRPSFLSVSPQDCQFALGGKGQSPDLQVRGQHLSPAAQGPSVLA